jgi:hypothetical protein
MVHRDKSGDKNRQTCFWVRASKLEGFMARCRFSCGGKRLNLRASRKVFFVSFPFPMVSRPEVEQLE